MLNDFEAIFRYTNSKSCFVCLPTTPRVESPYHRVWKVNYNPISWLQEYNWPVVPTWYQPMMDGAALPPPQHKNRSTFHHGRRRLFWWHFLPHTCVGPFTRSFIELTVVIPFSLLRISWEDEMRMHNPIWVKVMWARGYFYLRGWWEK